MRSGDVFDYQILRLTGAFYEAYPHSSYKEILNKAQRPYNCLLLQTRYEYFICIPYRSNISHKYAFHFKESKRSRENRSGLDYTKIVIIANKEFISSDEAIIDQDEYTETVRHIGRIRQDAERFVQDYIAHISGIHMLSEREFDRRYRYAPLKYFHEEMGIDSDQTVKNFLKQEKIKAD